MDKADKQKAEDVFKALGMTFSTGINIYIKAVGRARRIPFELAVNDADISASDKEKSFKALNGILAGHTIDLDKEREERLSLK
jgi:addiction module RelB/DinJ family antitoxin